MSRLRATFAEMLGFKAITGERDVTGNRGSLPSNVPLRKNAEIGRTNTLDDLSEAHVYDEVEFQGSEEDTDEDEALIEVTDHAGFVNSQLDPAEECPSVLNPNRFVSQNVSERKRK